MNVLLLQAPLLCLEPASLHVFLLCAVNALERMKVSLLAATRDACLALLEELKERITLLQQRPGQLDEFVAYQVGVSGMSMIRETFPSAAILV